MQPEQLNAELAKLAKKIMPSGYAVYPGEAYWSKRHGHAGSDMIVRALEKAKKLGFVSAGYANDGTPDGSAVNNGSAFKHQDGWSLTSHSHYGGVAYDNSFSMTLKML